MSIPAILAGAAESEHRILKVPGFEVALKLDQEMLDPAVMDRIALRLEVSVSNGRPQVTIVRIETETHTGYRLENTALIYESKVVPGSAEITGYEASPEQMVLVAV
jgi:hypothetical protein